MLKGIDVISKSAVKTTQILDLNFNLCSQTLKWAKMDSWLWLESV